MVTLLKPLVSKFTDNVKELQGQENIVSEIQSEDSRNDFILCGVIQSIFSPRLFKEQDCEQF